MIDIDNDEIETVDGGSVDENCAAGWNAWLSSVPLLWGVADSAAANAAYHIIC